MLSFAGFWSGSLCGGFLAASEQFISLSTADGNAEGMGRNVGEGEMWAAARFY